MWYNQDHFNPCRLARNTHLQVEVLPEGLHQVPHHGTVGVPEDKAATCRNKSSAMQVRNLTNTYRYRYYGGLDSMDLLVLVSPSRRPAPPPPLSLTCAVLYAEEVQLLPQLAVVPPGGLLLQVVVRLQLHLALPRGAMDALQHRLALITPPVGT